MAAMISYNNLSKSLTRLKTNILDKLDKVGENEKI